MDIKELRQLLPKNAQDAEAASRLVCLEPTILEPVVPDMVRRLKDHNSPVVDIYCNFFANHGEQYIDVIHAFLASTSSPELKNIIVTRILIHWPRESIAILYPTLGMLMSQTDFHNTDLVIIELLHRHKIEDMKILIEWLKFKRNRLSRLFNQADSLLIRLEQP